MLDPQLEAMVLPLLHCVRSIARRELTRTVLLSACRIMYTLCKVRGYKTIVKFVPHEVHDLEPLVALLASISTDDHEAWQVHPSPCTPHRIYTPYPACCITMHARTHANACFRTRT